jgi:hypothetical protein
MSCCVEHNRRRKPQCFAHHASLAGAPPLLPSTPQSRTPIAASCPLCSQSQPIPIQDPKTHLLQDDTLGVGRTTGRRSLVELAEGALLVVLVGPTVLPAGGAELTSCLETARLVGCLSRASVADSSSDMGCRMCAKWDLGAYGGYWRLGDDEDLGQHFPLRAACPHVHIAIPQSSPASHSNRFQANPS